MTRSAWQTLPLGYVATLLQWLRDAQRRLARAGGEALGDGLADALGDLRVALLDRAEVLVEQRDQRHRRHGGDRGGSPAVQHQPDLAEEVTGPELGDPLAVRGHLRLPVLDDEELV